MKQVTDEILKSLKLTKAVDLPSIKKMEEWTAAVSTRVNKTQLQALLKGAKTAMLQRVMDHRLELLK